MNTMKELLSLALISASLITFSNNAYAGDDIFSGGANQGTCNEVQGAMRDWYQANGFFWDDIGVTYCNAGAYVVKDVKFRMKRDGANTWFYEKKKTGNLTAGNAHWFFLDIGGSVNVGKKIKLEIIYDIMTGDKKHCVRTFTMESGKVVWLTKSGGTKTMGNKCKDIKFSKSWN